MVSIGFIIVYRIVNLYFVKVIQFKYLHSLYFMITLIYIKNRGEFMSEEPKKIEVVSGDGKDLNISEVSSHLNIAKPKIKKDDDKKQEIVIPEIKKKKEDKK